MNELIENLLRLEYWNNHGCNQSARYGDDGELQCGECITDFRRLPMQELVQHVARRRTERTVNELAKIEQLQAVLAYCGKTLEVTATFHGHDWTLAREAIRACIPDRPYDGVKVTRILLDLTAKKP